MNLLYITHHYHRSNMGAIRARRVARGLVRMGWRVTLLASGSREQAGVRMEEGVRIRTVDALSLEHVYARLRGRPVSGQPTGSVKRRRDVQDYSIGLSSFINKWFLLPDKQAPWCRSAIRAARDEAETQGSFDVLLASIYPRTCAVVGRDLSRAWGVPLVVEYRDLWTGAQYENLDQPTRLHRGLHRRLESSVLRQAVGVSCVCRGIRDYLGAAHPGACDGKFDLNYNFFDAAEYPARRAPRPGRPWTILYSGSVYLNRRPDMFFEGWKAFIDERSLTPHDVRFTWLGGIVATPGIREAIARLGLDPYIDYYGQVAHAESLQCLVDSDVSLLIQAPSDAIHIPGKLFEAMGAGTPILALSNPCETSEIIQKTGSGVVSGFTASEVKAALERLWIASQQEAPQSRTPEQEAYSSGRAVEHLSAFLTKCAGMKPFGG